MASEIATAYVKIIPTTKGIEGNLEKELSKDTDKVGNSIGNKLGKAIKAGIVVGAAGLATIIGKSIMEGGQLEQQLGGAEAVFGKFSKNIVESSKSAYKTAGLSQNEFLQGANKMGSLFKGAGHDVKSAMEMSENYMIRASDVASIMGVDTQEALEAVTGAAKGNFTMMDNLGVAMNATTLEAYALEKGIKKSWNSMTNAEKTGLAYQMFMEKTADYAGNYAKENETLAGSLNTLKTGFATLLGQLSQGQDISETMDGLKENAKNFLSAITVSLENVGKELPGVINELAPMLSELMNAFVPIAIPIIVSGLTSILSAIISNAPSMLLMISEQLIKGVPQILSAFGDAFNGASIGGKFALGILTGFAAYNLIGKITPILNTLKTAITGVSKIPPVAGGASTGTFLAGLANGLKAFGSPLILKGAAILGGAMIILSGATWASIQIISDSLPKLGSSLNSFNDVNGVNLLAVGGGLVALAAGLVAMTAGSLIDGLASFLGAGFGEALKGIIEPIATLMPLITQEDINKFHLLGGGMLALGIGFDKLKGFNNGTQIGTHIKAVNDAVVNAFNTGSLEMYEGLKIRLQTLKTALNSLANVQLNAEGITSFLTNVSTKITTLNNFDWAGAVEKTKNSALPVGKAVFSGIANGINQSNMSGIQNKIKTLNNFSWAGAQSTLRAEGISLGLAIDAGIASGIQLGSWQPLSAIRTLVRQIVAESRKEADVNSPSGVMERELGYWLGAGAGLGMPKGFDDYKPSFMDDYRTNLSKQTLNSGSTTQTVVMPDTFKIVDENGFVMKIKAIVDDKILVNNINKGWSG